MNKQIVSFAAIFVIFHKSTNLLVIWTSNSDADVYQILLE
jgi:hypothetical protein